MSDEKPKHHPSTRLEIELEFVQCLANPAYLTYLAQQKFLEDERFLNYLKYLDYFRAPEYAKLLTYPKYSLAALELLQQPSFRAQIASPNVAMMIRQQMHASYVPLPDKEGEEVGGVPEAADVTNGVNGDKAT